MVEVKKLRKGPTQSVLVDVRADPPGRGLATFTVGAEPLKTHRVNLTSEWQTIGSSYESSGPTVVGVRVESEAAGQGSDVRMMSL